jgi:hypothetical protein
MSHGEAHWLAGRRQDASRVLEEAVGIAEQKGNLVAAQGARDLLDRLQVAEVTRRAGGASPRPAT